MKINSPRRADGCKIVNYRCSSGRKACGQLSFVEVAVNGRSIGSTGPLPDSGVMHRDGIRSTEYERNLRFDTSLLKDGSNVIELKKNARAWTDGVLYDYVRLEIEEAK